MTNLKNKKIEQLLNYEITRLEHYVKNALIFLNNSEEHYKFATEKEQSELYSKNEIEAASNFLNTARQISKALNDCNIELENLKAEVTKIASKTEN